MSRSSHVLDCSASGMGISGRATRGTTIVTVPSHPNAHDRLTHSGPCVPHSVVRSFDGTGPTSWCVSVGHITCDQNAIVHPTPPFPSIKHPRSPVIFPAPVPFAMWHDAVGWRIQERLESGWWKVLYFFHATIPRVTPHTHKKKKPIDLLVLVWRWITCFV